jgi:hypothetical protein
MPDLEHTLQGHDLGFLKIVAGAWGVALNAPDAVTALPLVTACVLEHADFAEVIEALPQDAKNVLQALLQNDGRILWAAFARTYGDVRRMGAAKRDRERPDRRPATAVELLWYRGLVGRAFLNLPPSNEPQEYAYIPDDLLPLLPSLRADAPPPLGRPATPNESAHLQPASDAILDDACTLLAALRLKLPPAELAGLGFGGIPVEALKGLLRSAGLLEADDLPQPERTRAFLEAPRGAALAQLAAGWMEDPTYNELRLLPGLIFEGEWLNDALLARQAILELVSQIPADRWWSLPAFIAGVREQRADFQRPAGDYDSWFIRQENAAGSGFLRGFGAWDEVDGALVRFLITGPMHWLGLADLAAPSPDAPPTALRLSAWAEALWHGGAPEGLPAEEGQVQATADGRITLTPRGVRTRFPRAVRYQIARFCHWEGEKERSGVPEYHYRITPAALERARAQGLRASQLAGLLRRHSETSLPPTLVQALERWENTGTQAAVERAVLLRVSSPEILAALRKTRAARLLGEALNETTVLVRPGMEEQVLSALAEIGYLAEGKFLQAAANLPKKP